MVRGATLEANCTRSLLTAFGWTNFVVQASDLTRFGHVHRSSETVRICSPVEPLRRGQDFRVVFASPSYSNSTCLSRIDRWRLQMRASPVN